MTTTREREPKPVPGYFNDRPSRRSAERREEVYQAWLEKTNRTDTPEVRTLYFRRYSRPRPLTAEVWDGRNE